MDYEREARVQYQKAYSMAMRNHPQEKKNRNIANPITLNALLEEGMISCRIDLGIMEIPTNLIVGIAEPMESMRIFTRDFLPLADPDSESANFWRNTYQKYVADPNRSVIDCLEYLGKFYVLNGIQEVSVVKFYGACTIKARIIRMMPIKSEATAIRRYFDFLVHFHLTNLYQLQFTQPGYFEKLQRALDKEGMMQWNESDRSSFLMHWPKIERAFQKSFDNSLNITCADALVILLEKYPYKQLIQMDSWVLARIFQASWKDFYQFRLTNHKETNLCAASLNIA